MSELDQNRTFLWRAQKVFFWIGLVYVVGLGVLTIPIFQRQAIYVHFFKWPFFATFDAPHYHGLSPFKTANLKITTPDNVQLGAWFVLSEAAYRASGGIKRTAPPTTEEISQSLKDHPTVLFFHGNAATRAVKYRVQMYGQVTGRLGANVLVVDYRGFADSQGIPTEKGVNMDARGAWDWLVSNGAAPGDIVIIGQSLGTGITAKLVSQLAAEDVHPRGVMLTAAFSSVSQLLETYSFGGYVPLFRPLQIIPFASTLVTKFLHTRFNTKDIIRDIKCPLLIVHAKNDMTIPATHSKDLFMEMIEPHLPQFPDVSQLDIYTFSTEKHEELKKVHEARTAKMEVLVKTYQVGPEKAPFATAREFIRPENGNPVLWLETVAGGHSELVRHEGVIDFMAQLSRIRRE